jgi:2-methylisocitrate lyase-like PEP mutase family enzyme
LDSSGKRLRHLLARRELVVAPGAYDPYTARIIQSLGFPAVYLGGNAMGTQLVVGEPLMTLTETVDCAQRVLRAIDLPLIVDADAGFGDPIHTFRTVEEFERIGVAAIHIEDQPFPKRAHYHKGMGRVTDQEEVLDRLRAALEARRDPDFVIIGRTDILRITGQVGDAVKRAQAYLEVGVDMLMIMGPPTVEQARAIRAELPGAPLVWLSGTAGRELSNQEVAELGFDLVIFPVTAPVVITDAVLSVYSHLRDHGTLGLAEDSIAASRQKILDVLGMDAYWQLEARTTERA